MSANLRKAGRTSTVQTTVRITHDKLNLSLRASIFNGPFHGVYCNFLQVLACVFVSTFASQFCDRSAFTVHSTFLRATNLKTKSSNYTVCPNTENASPCADILVGPPKPHIALFSLFELQIPARVRGRRMIGQRKRKSCVFRLRSAP